MRTPRPAVITLVSVLAAISLAACAAPTPEATSPSSVATSPAEGSGSVADQLDAYWDYVSGRVNGADRPDVELVRLVDPYEWPQVQAECMHGEGFPDVAILPDGGLQPGLSDEAQESAYLLSRYVCTAKYPIDPKYAAPLTAEQIGAVYDYYLDDLVPCLEDNGYSVPEPPSREVFEENFAGERWSPYAEVFGADPSIPIDEYYRVSAECPQWPTDLFD
jgi:hypothetical protein